jgi:hypothetical protein
VAVASPNPDLLSASSETKEVKEKKLEKSMRSDLG